MIFRIRKNYTYFRAISLWVLCCIAFAKSTFPQSAAKLEHVKTIRGGITPKSIIYAGNGYFFAQNMMYSHKITVYDRNYRMVKSISDQVNLAQLGFPEHQGVFRGSPVEAAASHNGNYVWVTNYQMYGEGFDNPGADACGSTGGFDNSFVYRINAKTFTIDAAVKTGSVPKYIAVTPDNRYALVSNWCSGDLSIIDIGQLKEVRRVPLGMYPRGIAVDSKSEFAYVALMGDDNIARVRLDDLTVDMIENIGNGPRHLCITGDDRFLFVSLNAENQVIKMDLSTLKPVASVTTGITPRSMCLSADNRFLYVVNYNGNSLSVVTTGEMREVQSLNTEERPIGVATDLVTGNVWVACYSGSIQIFRNVIAPVGAVAMVRENKAVAESGNHLYHIIVGAYREEKNLKKMTAHCVKAGYQPYVINPEGEVKKLSCKGVADKQTALAELSKAKTIFGEGAWLLKQPPLSTASK